MKLIIASHGWNAGMHYHRIRPLYRTDVDFAVYDKWSDLKKINLSDYDFLIFNGTIAPGEDPLPRIQEAKDAGLKIVVDVDDYWVLPKHHPMRFNEDQYKKWQKEIIQNIKHADIVWTTTPELTEKIRELTQAPVWLIRNAIDYEEWQWMSDLSHRFKVKQTALGYIGGRTHYKDLDPIKSVMSKLQNDYKDKLWINIMGVTQNSQDTVRVWNNMINCMNPKKSKNVKLWKLVHWSEYGFYYDYNDFVLASVQENDFNACKSELKILEAGAKWTPIVCSDFPTYNRIGFDELKVASTPKEWFNHLEELLLSKEERDRYGKLLGQFVREEYNIDKENEFRLESLR